MFRTTNRFEQLSPAARRLMRVPRYARLITLLDDEQRASLTTEASLFWTAYSFIGKNPKSHTGVIDDGLRSRKTKRFGWHSKRTPNLDEPTYRRWQIELAMAMLGAVAFEIMFGKGAELPAKNIRYTIDRDIGKFIKRTLLERFVKAGAYVDVNDKGIAPELVHDDWQTLVRMDSHGLKHFLFSSAEKIADRELIRFNDISTQAFLAAYWVCNFGSPRDEFDRLWSCVPDPLFERNPAYAEFWNFVAEMPDDALRNGPELWQELISPIFDTTLSKHLRDSQNRPMRATELIFRAWERMQGTEAVAKFFAEFDAILGPREKGIAQKMFDGFIPLGQQVHGPQDNGGFTMGCPDTEATRWDSYDGVRNNPEHEVELSIYQLHQFCVTNVEFELFDPRHKEKRKFETQVLCVDEHPVVGVSWFDAICFARWIGQRTLPNGQRYRIELPTEAQWEYACRAGQRTPFSWTGGLIGNVIESGNCNFDGNHPWPNDGPDAARKSDRPMYLARTIPVNGMLADGTVIGINPWGFSQMHGNIWEWCWDWYDPQFYYSSSNGVTAMQNPMGPQKAVRRVLRGGSRIDLGEFCRSASRYRFLPSYRYWGSGFRLAAVPLSPGGHVGKIP